MSLYNKYSVERFEGDIIEASFSEPGRINVKILKEETEEDRKKSGRITE